MNQLWVQTYVSSYVAVKTGDVQTIVWPKVFAKCRRALSNQLILLTGHIDRWDETTNIVAERIEAIGADLRMPMSHDWH